jgi:hypothetical protein
MGVDKYGVSNEIPVKNNWKILHFILLGTVSIDSLLFPRDLEGR